MRLVEHNGKVLSYSLTSVGPRFDPGVLAVSLEVNFKVIPPVVGCHYFLPDCIHLRAVTVLQPVPSYTVWWHRYIGVNNLPKVVMQLPMMRIKPMTCWSQVHCSITKPLCHHNEIVYHKNHGVSRADILVSQCHGLCTNQRLPWMKKISVTNTCQYYLRKQKAFMWWHWRKSENDCGISTDAVSFTKINILVDFTFCIVQNFTLHNVHMTRHQCEACGVFQTN